MCIWVSLVDKPMYERWSLINIKIKKDTTILILYISYTHILGAKNCKNNFSTVAVININ